MPLYDAQLNMQRPGVLAATQSIWDKLYINDTVAYTDINFATANKGWFAKIWNPLPFTATHGWVLNGGTTSGNLDIGIYAVDSGSGAVKLIGSTGGFAQGTISVVQFQAMSPEVVVPAGEVVLAISGSSATGRIATRNYGGDWDSYFRQLAGVGTAPSMNPLPASVTAAAMVMDTFFTSGLPLFGVCNRLY